MKRWYLLTLILALLMSATPVLAEESNEGTVTVIDDWNSVQDTASDITYDTEPYVPEDIDKTIFGSDNRITVYNPSNYPFSAIAYMKVRYGCGCSQTGTGFMVDYNRLLTAGHVLVCSKHSSWANAITFYFGYNGDKNYRYCYNGRWQGWAGNPFSDRKYSINNDFGCIKLYENVGNQVGWLGTHWNLSDTQMEHNFFCIPGYRNGTLYYDSGWVSVLDSTHITYTIDTLPGTSGSPIVTEDFCAVGINIAEDSRYNIGYRLNANIKNRLYDLW